MRFPGNLEFPGSKVSINYLNYMSKQMRTAKHFSLLRSKRLPLSRIVALVFCLCTLWGYHTLRSRQDQQLAKIYSTLTHLENKKAVLQLEEERMREEIASQSDPAWVEMVLIKKLGYAPKGSSKILFSGGSLTP